MKTFLGMEIEQSNRSITLHLDHYIREMLNEYKTYIKKSLRPKCVPFSPGVILRPEDSPTLPDPSNFIKAEVLQVICCQESVCGFVDSLRYFVCNIAVGSILCFGRLNPLGSTSSLDGVHRGPSKLQDHLSPPNQAQPGLALGMLTRIGEIARLDDPHLGT